MEMTFEQYIQNPMGKHNAVLNSIMRESMRSSYMDKFNKIMVREHGIVNYNLYKDSKKNRYYIYLKIPSEVVPKFYYDVVLEFYTNSDVKESGQNLMKYNVRFFSNDPAFVYTYAHVFNKNNLFIKELKSKMSNKAIRDSAKEKNPSGNVGYVKSLYFAYLAIRNKGLNRVSLFDSVAEISWSGLLNKIENADSKIQKRQDEGNKLQKQKTKSKQDRIKSVNTDNRNRNLKVSSVKSTRSIKSIKSIKTVNGVKMTKRK